MTDQDREQVVEHVTTAYAEGRLDKIEFDERLHAAMTARTHADLAPIMQDLYGARAVPAPPPRFRQSACAPRRYTMPVTGGERLAAMAAHVLPICGLSFVGPLIVLLAGGRTSPFIRAHAVEALNFHLTLAGAVLLLPFTVVGVLLIPVLVVAGVVLGIIGAATAAGDQPFRYPWTLRPVK
ncbi:DUF1707 and DUF4870 domain-containing protein [Sphaerisporangium aureirubrum]|uniref:DUF1707 and DUF4870 domain-containing protein n=1 Tax=Sphaerisporangium aureirubrum TaxID=1544736 RepID=A0ABW1NAK5_9ACTN